LRIAQGQLSSQEILGMMKKRALIFIITLMYLNALVENPQTEPKHYAKDGLSFDYPAGWTLGPTGAIFAVRAGGQKVRGPITYNFVAL
jgi:hypothetical protein